MALAITCNNPPSAIVGASYSHFFPATGGTAPYSFAITAGVLPTGLTLNAATGEVSGIPTASGTFSFTVEVEDSSGGGTITGWTSEIAAEDNAWRGIAWSPEQGLFVAVSTNGTSRVMTSPDGINWTSRTEAEPNAWRAIAWSPELGLFAAVATSGANRVMTSPDGFTWTAQAAAEANSWVSIAWSPDLLLFVAVSEDGVTQVMTSPDGIIWTGQTAAESSGWESIAWSPDLALFAAVSGTATNRVMTSPDGVSWTSHAAAEANFWTAIAWSPDLALFAAVSSDGTNQIMTSSDGASWTSGTAAEVAAWRAIAWSPELGLFAAVASNAADQTMYSNDGLMWTSATAALTNSWRGVTWSSALGLFAAISQGDASPRVMISTSAGGGGATADVTCSIFTSAMTPEVKLRTLAAADATLQSFFYNASTGFRWYDTELPQGQLPSGACVIVRRVSTVRTYEQRGLQNLSQPRFQIDVLPPNTVNKQSDPEAGRAAAAAIIAFLGTINLATTDQFGSPVTTPQNFPNFVLNQRLTSYPQLQPPVLAQTIDIRVYNLEN